MGWKRVRACSLFSMDAKDALSAHAKIKLPRHLGFKLGRFNGPPTQSPSLADARLSRPPESNDFIFSAAATMSDEKCRWVLAAKHARHCIVSEPKDTAGFLRHSLTILSNSKVTHNRVTGSPYNYFLYAHPSLPCSTLLLITPFICIKHQTQCYSCPVPPTTYCLPFSSSN